MAHFAEIGLDNVVQRVIVVNNNEMLDENGVEQEALGAEFCRKLFGGTWIQTSYNGNFRKNFAGAGFKYYTNLDGFAAPRPYDSWSLNETTCQWEPPVPMPEDGVYRWDEATGSWIEVTNV